MAIRRPVLRLNDNTPDNKRHISFLQQKLVEEGYLTKDQVDGVFGEITLDAVKQYQEKRGLQVDGVVAINTWRELGMHGKQKDKQLQIDPPSSITSGVEDLTYGLDLIRQFEGFSLTAYPDPLTGNKPITIGYGSTRKLDGSPWSLGERLANKAEAEQLLRQQLESDYLPRLRVIPGWSEMNAYQHGALISFAWNVGAGFYDDSNFNTITNALKEQTWEMVPKALMLYVNPGTNVTKGLRTRRQIEGNMWSRKS